MNPTNIKSLKSLPAWFDIERYEALNDLDEAHLLKELFWRNYTALFQRLNVEPDAESFFSSITNSPIDLEREIIDSHHPLVTELSLRDLDELAGRISFWNEHITTGEPADSDSLESIHPFVYDSYDHVDAEFPYSYFRVALGGKKAEVLKEFEKAFDKVVEKHRIDNSLETERIETTFSKIVSYKSIPYLDLKLWEKFENCKISNSLMARVLYPKNENRGEDDIRKYTKKYADKGISLVFLESAIGWLDSRQNILTGENLSDK